MTVARICSRIIATASPTDSIGAAARLMAEYDVGSLVVMREEGRGSRAVGLITDRDIAVRCVGARLDPDQTPVSQIMGTELHTVSDDMSIDEALARMAGVGTRRLVVTADGGRPAGILTLDDVLSLLAREAGAIGQLLEKQQPRVPA
jgi:CBS domain-containing protein